MDRVSCSLASVVADIKLDRGLGQLRIDPVRIVTHTHRLHDLLLQGLFLACPKSESVGKVMQRLTRDDRLAVAHCLQQYKRTQQNAGCDPPSDRSWTLKHELLLSALSQCCAGFC